MSTTENSSMNENYYMEKERREFQEAKERYELKHGHQNFDKNDLIKENFAELNNEVHPHQEKHGHRKYKMFTNHDSSRDQPFTKSGPGTI